VNTTIKNTAAAMPILIIGSVSSIPKYH